MTHPAIKINEKDFQAQVRQLAELNGWRVWASWRSFNSPKGEPDLRLVRPPRVVFAELKTDKGKLTEHQYEGIGDLMRCPGVEVHVWRPSDWDEIVETLR